MVCEFRIGVVLVALGLAPAACGVLHSPATSDAVPAQGTATAPAVASDHPNAVASGVDSRHVAAARALHLAQSELDQCAWPGLHSADHPWLVWPTDVADDVPRSALVFGFFGPLHCRTNNLLMVRWDSDDRVVQLLRERIWPEWEHGRGGRTAMRLASTYCPSADEFLDAWRATLLIAGVEYCPPPASGQGSGGGTTHNSGDFVRVWQDEEVAPRLSLGFWTGSSTETWLEEAKARAVIDIWSRLAGSWRRTTSDPNPSQSPPELDGPAGKRWGAAAVETLRRELDRPQTLRREENLDAGWAMTQYAELVAELADASAEPLLERAMSEGAELAPETLELFRLRTSWNTDGWRPAANERFVEDLLHERRRSSSRLVGMLLQRMAHDDADRLRRFLLSQIERAPDDLGVVDGAASMLRVWGGERATVELHRLLSHPSPTARVIAAVELESCRASNDEVLKVLLDVACDARLACSDDGATWSELLLRDRAIIGLQHCDQPLNQSSLARLRAQTETIGERPSAIIRLADVLAFTDYAIGDDRLAGLLVPALDRPVGRELAIAAWRLAAGPRMGDDALRRRLLDVVDAAERLGWPEGTEQAFRSVRARLADPAK